MASSEEAFETAEEVMAMFLAGEGNDGIMEFLPDSVIDSALERKRSKLGDRGVKLNDVTLTELLELAPAADFSADHFAMRGCILAQPASALPLSTLRISPQKCLQRYAVTTASGEEMVLVLTLELAEALEPKYRSVRVVTRWFLRSIKGEPAEQGVPEYPARQHGPEAVVQAQLEALAARDAAKVFRFALPRNKETFGNDPAVFEMMLQNQTYEPLLGHASAEVLKCNQMTRDRAFVIVGLTARGGSSATPQNYVFGWALSLQDDSAGDLSGCWLTDSVYPLGGGGYYVI